MKFVISAVVFGFVALAGVLSIGAGIHFALLGSKFHSGADTLQGFGFWFIGFMSLLAGIIGAVASLVSRARQAK